MDERKTITLLYNYNENWIGGTYYILNIIKSLNILDDAKKPKIKILYNSKESLVYIKQINYPFIEFIFYNNTLSFFKRFINKLVRQFVNTIVFTVKVKGVDNIYPMEYIIKKKDINRFHFWIPDFQEQYLPELFNTRVLNYRKLNHLYLVKKNYPIIFSSNTALNDYNKFYPNNKNPKKVLKFVSVLENNFASLDINILKDKFNITKKYFIISNQFWVHKNHKIILETVKAFKNEFKDIIFVFTGKEFDKRNPHYTSELKNYIKENNLTQYFKFLGFIKREEQLLLMKYSIAIVQPSLFEGWSTVVEDAKALNHSIILSDIPIHREQMEHNCLFFDPLNKKVLKDKLLESINNNLITHKFNIKKEQLQFAENIISILD